MKNPDQISVNKYASCYTVIVPLHTQWFAKAIKYGRMLSLSPYNDEKLKSLTPSPKADHMTKH